MNRAMLNWRNVMNILIRNAKILTMVDDNILDGSVGICNGEIVFIGDTDEAFIPDKIIDADEKIVMPGLVNSHTHIAMSLLRNYADDLPLWPWLTEKIWPVEEKLIAEDVYWGSMLSVAEMIKSGITSFADMYFFMDETAKVVEETGIRANLCKGLVGSADAGGEKIKAAVEFFKKWHGAADGRISVIAGPHAPYTCSDDYLEKVMGICEEHGMGIHIHLSESTKEVSDSYDAKNLSPIQHMNKLGLFNHKTIAAHCVHLDDKDIEILAEKGVSVANNPGSNLKLGNGFAPVAKLLKAGVNVCLGTDGSSSNNNLNMFEEMNLAALVNKAVGGDTTVVPAFTALQMATINGAKALGIDHLVGTLEVGKRADLILIDLDKPHFYPRHNLLSSLVYSAQASDVETVIVDGKVVMEDYELKTIDLKKVYVEVEKCVDRLIRS